VEATRLERGRSRRGGARCARVDARARAVAERVVSALDLVAVDGELLADAAVLEPVELRTLDDVQLASALLVREAVGVAIAYDARLLEAMSAAGPPAVAPA
jgi:hypothetical protein